MNEFRKKLLSQGFLGKDSPRGTFTVPDPDGGTAKIVRDENGHDTVTRDDGRVDVTINLGKPVSAEGSVRY